MTSYRLCCKTIRMIKSPTILLLLSIALLAELALAAMTFQPTLPAAHPTFVAMEIGGERAVDDANHWWLGTVTGLTLIGFLTTCLTLASSNLPDKTSLVRWIVVGGVVFAMVFLAIMVAYHRDVASDPLTLFGPFPSATTWMVFGLWGAPVFFVAIYVVGFRRWFLPSDSTDSQPSD